MNHLFPYIYGALPDQRSWKKIILLNFDFFLENLNKKKKIKNAYLARLCARLKHIFLSKNRTSLYKNEPVWRIGHTVWGVGMSPLERLVAER